MRLFLIFLGSLIFSLSACQPQTGKKERVFSADLQGYAESGGRRLHHWRLDIPDSYIFEKKGRNGKPSHNRSTEKKNRQVIKIHAVLDPETMEISPHPNKRRGGGDDFVFIRISNGHLIKSLMVDQCLNKAEASKLAGHPHSLNPCHEGTPNCVLSTHLDGWPILLTVKNEFFNEPEEHCKAIRNFLDKMTIRRDALPGR